ncbi:MAG TPA: hypothetical protein VMZ03_09785 [Chitinophagaceae bacterium]|nr:hypothetical protein [Chitinophagaceae bacterium]
MKKVFLFLSIIVFSLVTRAQKDDHTLTFDGIGELKLGLTKAQLEKMLNTRILLKQIGLTESFTETVKTMYKGIEFELDLMRNDNVVAALEGVSTTSPLFKTPEGIGVGSDQLTIINAYEKDLLIISYGSITYTNINQIHASIVFVMENKKVVKVIVEPTAMFRDRE